MHLLLFFKKLERLGSMPQMAECFPSKHKQGPEFKLSTTKIKKKKKQEKEFAKQQHSIDCVL
jgi:hypothetical protein